MKYDGKNPAKEDLEADRPGRKNLQRIRVGLDRREGRDKDTTPVTSELLQASARVCG